MRRIVLSIYFAGLILCACAGLRGQEIGSPEIAALVSSGREMVKKGDVAQVLKTLTRAFELAQSEADLDMVALGCLVLESDFFDAENARAGEQVLDLAIGRFEARSDEVRLRQAIMAGVVLGEKHKNRATAVRYRRQLANYYARRGDSEQEEEALTRIIDGVDLSTSDESVTDVLLRLEKLYAQSKNTLGSAVIAAGLGRIKERNGDIDGALKQYESAIEGLREHPDSTMLSQILSRSALLLRQRGNYSKAAGYLRQAADLDRAKNDGRGLSVDLFNLALVYQNLGQMDQAVQQIEESLKTVRSAGSREDLARALIGAASIYRDAGKLDPALRALDEVLTIAREDGREDLKLEARQALAAIRQSHGQSVSAAANLDLARDMMRNRTGEGDATSLELRTTAMALLLKGDAKAALPMFIEAVKRAKARLDLDELVEARRGLAQAYGYTGDFSGAETPLLENLELSQQRGDIQKSADTLALLASVYVELGRYYDALARYAQLQKLTSGRGAESLPERLHAMLAASEIYLHLQDYERALETATGAIDLSTHSDFREDAGRAERLAGRICLAQRQFGSARAHFLSAEKFDDRKMIFNEGLVEVYLGTGDFRQALTELSKVQTEQLALAGEELQWRFYTQRGLAHLGSGDFQSATADFNDAISKIEYSRLDVIGKRSFGYLDAGDFGARIRAYRGMMETFANLRLLGLTGKVATLGEKHVELPVAALHFAELARARSQFDSMSAARNAALEARLPKALKDKQESILRERERLRSELKALEQRGEKPGPTQMAAAKKLHDDAGELIKAFRRGSPAYELMLGPGIGGIESLVMDDGEVILEYAIGIRRLFLFVIRKSGIELMSVRASIDDLASEVQAFRDLISEKRFPESTARRLYGELLGLAESYIKPSDRIFIVPDGFLGLLPFEALVPDRSADGGGATFFGAIHQVAYAHSVSSIAIARMASRPSGKKPLFALADPIYDAGDPRYQAADASPAGPSPSDQVLQQPRSPEPISGGRAGGYRRLPDTRDEVGAIASIMEIKPEPPDVLTDRYAEKAAFLKSDLGAYRFIHLATHAAALGELGRVNEPFLVLGLPASGRLEDQILKMSEVMNLNLSAELVVLAACDTGRGDVFQGDGVASLASAFMYAGADNVLLSLWKLPSRPTVFFMRKFYEFVHEGHSEMEALQLSKEAMRSVYKDPYYWAVFVLYASGNAPLQRTPAETPSAGTASGFARPELR